MDWKIILTVLCLFGLLKELRPSEPFVYNMLIGPWKNFTEYQVSHEIYPVSIYSYFATLIIIFLLTDLLRYKPIIVLCGLSGGVTFLMLIIGTTIPVMQALEFTYGLFMSTEVAYYTYIYAKVDKKHYEKATSCTRAAFLVGKFSAGAVGQLMVNFNLLDYYQLNYLTFTAMVLATICALFLPSVDHSIYFHRGDGDTEKIKSSVNDITLELKHQPALSFSTKLKRAYGYLWKDFLQAFSNFEVIKWSLWWALATCGYSQVITYIQNLWETAVREDDVLYNGAVEAIYTIIGAATVSCVGIIKINWTLYGEAALASFSILEGLLLLAACRTFNIFVMYGCYITFGVIYHTIVTVASFEVAKRLSEDSYGLIFGINTFLALAVQSLLMYIVVDGIFFESTIRDQFFIYSFYFIALGVIFAMFAIRTIFQYCRNRHTQTNDCTEINS